MAYTILMHPTAIKVLAKLPRVDQLRIKGKIYSLARRPRPSGTVKLAGADDLYRIRVGDYRIVYQIDDPRLLVLVIRIGHRREVYRGL